MTTDLINEKALRQALEPIGFDCCYLPETESTNTDALQYFNLHQRPVVAVSEAQTSGRGRRGRQWLSPFARNIYCTIGITKTLAASDQGMLSLVTGVALCRVLRQQLGIELSLKWPNDLLFQGSKLGGILIESRPLESDSFFFAIGFGLNVFMDSKQLARIPQAATSLHLICADDIDRTEILIACIRAVVQAIRIFDAAAASELIDEFRQYDAYHGKAIEVITAQGNRSGINRGISPRGELLFESDGEIEALASAEISMALKT